MRSTDNGFTLVELMVVVLIIGILVTIAIPVYNATRAQAERRTCFANQRMIDGAASLWEGTNSGTPVAALAGPLDAAHPLIVGNFIRRPPACPTPPNPQVNGLYTLDAVGSVLGCTWGTPAHGRFDD